MGEKSTVSTPAALARRLGAGYLWPMSDAYPRGAPVDGQTAMPRSAVALAGLVILAAALASLVMGVVRNSKGHGDSDEVVDVAPVKPVATAQPLTTPPVTETDVRRWAREEVQTALASRAAKKARSEDEAAADATDSAAASPAPGAGPTVGGSTVGPAKPQKPASATQPAPIPF